MAIWELAPGSPWNAIFRIWVMVPSSSRSAFGKNFARGFQIGRGIDAARHGFDDGDVDPHACLECAQLLQLFLLLQRRRRQADETLQRRASVRIKPDVVIARPVAVRGGGA